MDPAEIQRQISYHRREYLRLSAIAGENNNFPTIKSLIDELYESNRQLDELVMTDHLTGIGNRRFYQRRLDQLLMEGERGRAFSVILLDIDHFKQYNDSFGHLAGDQAIIKVADILKTETRKIDCVARYGGEEFIIASAITLDGAISCGEKLRSCIASSADRHRELTVSVGVAEYVLGDDGGAIFTRADTALYQAKNLGRNRLAVAA